MLRLSVLSFLLFAILLPLCLPAAAGFDVESAFLAVPSSEGAREALKYYTSLDHVAGTQGDYETAVYTQQRLTAMGLTAEIQPFRVGLNYPLERSLTLLSPTRFEAGLSEPVLEEDPTSDNVWRNRTFHGYAASGDVTAELIYVNYGARAEFQWLKDQGVELAGKIALVRYGAIFRGLKVKNAQDFGMAGCIIYSDPKDDGVTKGPVYPSGPWRPELGVQRGSVQFLSTCSGDPFFLDRDPEVCGFTTEDLIPSIPSLPISWGDAQPLLEALGGMPAPADWVGGLNITYNIGPGPALVHLSVQMNYTNATLWDVVATIPGSDPDPEVASQLVLIGNHRDAWVLGSTDPNSGTASMLELAQGLSELVKQGWSPRRTIKILSWDGEEYGLLGSVWYGETNREELTNKAIIYLNVDIACTGPQFGVQLTPSLGSFLTNATLSIVDPNTNRSLYSVWDKSLGRLGSGSDFAVFLHHLGVPSLDMFFQGDYGVYHSVYDSFYWTSHFGDPTFDYHRAMAQLWGLLAIRMSDAWVLPFNFDDVATQLSLYLTEATNAATKAGLIKQLTFSKLDGLINQDFNDAASLLECYRQFALNDTTMPLAEVSALNVALYQMERGFLDQEGLPHRPWFKHVIQAPGLQEGYASNVFPGLLDALAEKDVQLAQQQIDRIAQIIGQVATNMAAAIPDYRFGDLNDC